VPQSDPAARPPRPAGDLTLGVAAADGRQQAGEGRPPHPHLLVLQPQGVVGRAEALSPPLGRLPPAAPRRLAPAPAARRQLPVLPRPPDAGRSHQLRRELAPDGDPAPPPARALRPRPPRGSAIPRLDLLRGPAVRLGHLAVAAAAGVRRSARRLPSHRSPRGGRPRRRVYARAPAGDRRRPAARLGARSRDPRRRPPVLLAADLLVGADGRPPLLLRLPAAAVEPHGLGGLRHPRARRP